jgi:hypothetical protein
MPIWHCHVNMRAALTIEELSITSTGIEVFLIQLA